MVVEGGTKKSMKDSPYQVTPVFHPKPVTSLKNIAPGCSSGSNSGLQLLLDAEVFDYGTPTT